MRQKVLIGICILAMVAGVYFFSRGWISSGESGSPPELEAVKGIQTKGNSSPETSPLSETKEPDPASDNMLTPEDREKKLLEERQKKLFPTMEELGSMGDTPVEFYGQVLDQFDNPVVGAKIRCSWGIYGQRVSPVELQSNAPNGQFEIRGIKAIAISVFVHPPSGYAQLLESKKKIQIAEAPERILQNEDYKKMTPEQKEMWGKMHGFGVVHKPDKAKPVIFRLTKL